MKYLSRFKIRKKVVSALIGYQPKSIKSWMILLDNHVDIHDKCDFSILKTLWRLVRRIALSFSRPSCAEKKNGLHPYLEILTK